VEHKSPLIIKLSVLINSKLSVNILITFIPLLGGMQNLNDFQRLASLHSTDS